MTEQHTHHSSQSHKPEEQNGLAIASLVLGITSLTGLGALTGIPAIITGAMSLKNPALKGMGIAGLVMGGISTVFSILLVLFFIIVVVMAAIAASTHQDAPSSIDPGSDLYDSSHSQSI